MWSLLSGWKLHRRHLDSVGMHLRTTLPYTKSHVRVVALAVGNFHQSRTDFLLVLLKHNIIVVLIYIFFQFIQLEKRNTKNALRSIFVDLWFHTFYCVGVWVNFSILPNTNFKRSFQLPTRKSISISEIDLGDKLFGN